MATPHVRQPHKPQVYRARDVAEMLGISLQLTKRLRQSGRLKGRWLTPATWVIERKDLLAYVRSCPRLKPHHPNDMAKAREAQRRKWASADPRQVSVEGKQRAATG